MDLGTIHTRMLNGRYSHPGDVYADIQLVWRNCLQYNEASSLIAQECRKLAAVLDRLWKLAGLDPFKVWVCM
jgi:hypothetical protein